MTNAQFLDHAFDPRRSKILGGFSRPFYHNLAGWIDGHQFNKREYGGMIRHTEGAMLYRWAAALAPNSTIVEIGCYGGLSTSFMARGCQRNGSKIYAIDPFDSDLPRQEDLCDGAVALERKPSRALVRQRLEQSGLADRVELIEGFSQEVVKTWNRGIDFLWIDGNHDQAFQDYVDWSRFLNPRARVAIHDAHPRYGIRKVAEDARRIFSSEDWVELEHVKSILTGVKGAAVTGGKQTLDPSRAVS